jgi:hypothetical protein
MAHVLEQREKVHLLLVGAAHGRTVRLAHDGHDGDVVGQRVVQSVQEVDRVKGLEPHLGSNTPSSDR